MKTIVSGHPVFTLRRFEAGSPLIEDALRVYLRAWPEDNADECRVMFAEFAGYREFVGLVACVDGAPVGMGYGARTYPSIWWHDEVALRLGADYPPLQDAWRLVELAVDPDWQGRGVGSALHDALLATHDCPRAVIATTAANARARGMYERRGWRCVSSPLHLPGKAEAHVVFGRECNRD